MIAAIKIFMIKTIFIRIDKDHRHVQVNLTWSTDSLAPVTQYTLHYRKSQVVRMMLICI